MEVQEQPRHTAVAQQTARGLKYRWHLPKINTSLAHAVASRHALSIPVAHFLASRELSGAEQIERLLTSDFDRDIAHPSLLADSELAVQRIEAALASGEKILVFGDYDVDGITSTSLILVCLAPLGAKINFFLPNRARDGYGLSVSAVEKAAANDFKLIITVDNGISAVEAAHRAHELGIDLIITDHHKVHGELPQAHAIVDPMRPECKFPNKNLAGVGVAFKIMSLLYEKRGIQLPAKTYELLALGTIADVVPLIDENRFWVRHGLTLMNKNPSEAIRTLATNARLESKLTSQDIAFMIAPQINALGRLDDSRDGVKLLVTSNSSEIQRICTKLKECNDKRKQVEREIYDEIEVAITMGQIDLDRELTIFSASKDWKAGVIGLVAGRFAEDYGRPSFLFHLRENGFASGSCRSSHNIDIHALLAANSHLLEKFGGHTFAAGLTLKAENLPKLKVALEGLLAERFTPDDLRPEISIDAPLELPEANKKLISDLERLEPFGCANESPKFIVEDATLVKPPAILKERHTRLTVFSQGTIKPVIFFNRPDVYKALHKAQDANFDLAARVVKNEWQGSVSIELRGIDLRIRDNK